ncbi:uncharacterized protein LOC558926 precursor [Danio rerio]|uniref:Uncharacterized protein LOC558926 precursor n=1 Tax=Danio rerio TaxID=7955 RepID=A8WFT0_DANRE|nr:uncharacterized protein LOC558926 precursor [Danio rerio]AAI54446.1 Zgc:171490 protein [Danio rerio]|eukprot:NP_001107058.1 uncharacterized protein LOC558926 precursor [Danio rerio]
MKMKLSYYFHISIWCFLKSTLGVFGVEEGRVSVMDGDSVTLYTGVRTGQHEGITWYFNLIRIALINGDRSKSCTDVQCNLNLKAKNERFRNRLKLDEETGDLTILNIRTADDTGDYQLIIHSNSSNNKDNIEKTFRIAADTSEMKSPSVKEGESVTLDPGVNAYNEMSWYFSDILIARLTGNQSQICTNAECKERFTDRLKTENDSLNITNSRSTDSGEYKLMINCSTFSIIRKLTVNVTNSAHPEVIAYVLVAAVFAAAAAAAAAAVVAVILCWWRYNSSQQNGNRTGEQNTTNGPEVVPLNSRLNGANGTSNEANCSLLPADNENGLAANGTPQ